MASEDDILASLKWVPPAPDPDRQLKIDAHNDRVAATVDCLHRGLPLRVVPTWQQRKAVVEAKASAEAKATQESAERVARVAELEAGVAKLGKEIQTREREAKIAEVDARMASIAADRATRGKRTLPPNELRVRALKSLAGRGLQ